MQWLTSIKRTPVSPTARCFGRVAIPTRVLVPFGLIPEKAAKGCWGEALRLVLAPSQVASTTPTAARKQRDKVSDPDAEEEEEEAEEEEEEEKEGSVTELAKDEKGVDPLVEGRDLTLPGGLWDEVNRSGASMNCDLFMPITNRSTCPGGGVSLRLSLRLL